MHACCISSNHTPNHATNHTHEWFWSNVWKHAACGILLWQLAMASPDDICFVAWSLVCSVYVYSLACWPCLSRYGRSQGCQTISPEWMTWYTSVSERVHLFCFVFDKALTLFFFIFKETVFCPRPSHTPNHTRYRYIPRIIPQTSLCCVMAEWAPFGPSENNPSPVTAVTSLEAWCRREPFDIGLSLYVDSKEGRANHTPNHSFETYLESYLRIRPPMQHALVTPRVFGNSHISNISHSITIWQIMINTIIMNKNK